MWNRPELLCALFALGEREEGARLLADVVARPDMVVYFLARVVGALVEAGEDDRAAALVAGTPAAEARELLAASLVRKLVAAGRHDRAEEYARDIGWRDGPPSLQGLPAWADLAVVAESARGRVMMARVLQHEYVVNVLQAVLRVEPRALPVVLEAVRRPDEG